MSTKQLGAAIAASTFLGTVLSFGQAVPGWVWTVSMGTPDTPLAARIDNQGNVRTVGYQGVDAYFHVHDSNGMLLMSSKCTNSGPSFLAGAIDSVGNSYLTGQFTRNGQFGPFKLTDSGGSSAAFVAKYSPAGVALWAVGSTGGAGVTGWAIAADDSGNSYVTGEFSGSSATPNLQVKIGGIAINNYTVGDCDGFVAKIDPNGKVLWATRFGDGAVRRCMAICVDKAGNAYTAANSLAVGSSGQAVYKFDSSGKQVWTRTSRSTAILDMSRATSTGIAADAQGNVSVAGTIMGTNVFGNVTLIAPPAPLTPNTDLEVTRYDSAGNVLWACKDGGTNMDVAGELTCDNSGTAFVHGAVDTVSTIGGTRLTNTTSGALLWYIAKCKSSGGFEWAVPLPSPAQIHGPIAVALDGTLFLASQCGGGQPVSSLSRLGMVDPPQITIGPTNQTIKSGATATLVVQGTPSATLSYQWYRGSTGDTRDPIPGATTNTYKTVSLSQTASFWVRLSNVAGHADSATATITIPVVLPPQISSQPKSTIINPGRTVTLSVIAAGTGPLSYQWYEVRAGNNYWPVGDNTNTYTTAPLTSTAYFKVRVSNEAGVADSDQVAVRVVSPIQIIQQPQSVAITNGQSVTLSVIATGPPVITYQWYLGESGDTNTPVASGLINSYTTPPLRATTRYWALLWSEGGTVATQTAVLSLPEVNARLGLSGFSGGQLNFRLTAAPGTKWGMEASTDLRSWSPVAGLETIPLGASGTTNLQPVVKPDRCGFYRVRQK